MPVQTKFQNRRDTAANWTSTNPTLSSGEFGYETDTGKVKIGDGSTAWTSLAYITAAAGGSGMTELDAQTFTSSTTYTVVAGANLLLLK
jgi:hypothetical protein